MKAKVLQKFKDKHTGAIHERGDVIEITEKRLAELKKAGRFVVEIAEDKTSEASEEKPKKRRTKKAADADAE